MSEGSPGGIQKTRAARYLERHPEQRQKVVESAEFQRRLEALEVGAMTIDGERLYFPWGDTPKDLEEVIFDEGVRTRVINPQDVDQDLGGEDL